MHASQTHSWMYTFSHWHRLTHSPKLRIWGCTLEPDHKVTLDQQLLLCSPQSRLILCRTESCGDSPCLLYLPTSERQNMSGSRIHATKRFHWDPVFLDVLAEEKVWRGRKDGRAETCLLEGRFSTQNKKSPGGSWRSVKVVGEQNYKKKDTNRTTNLQREAFATLNSSHCLVSWSTLSQQNQSSCIFAFSYLWSAITHKHVTSLQ